MRFQFTLVLILSSIIGYSQTITVNTKEGRKTFIADKSKACNPERVFMIVSPGPAFNESNGTLVDKVNDLVKLDERTKGDFSVWFTVNCKGEAFGFQVLKGINEEVDKKIVDALNTLQGWQPAKHSSKSVDCMQTVNFQIKRGKIKGE